MRSRHLCAIFALLAAATFASPAAAEKATDTLRIVWRNAIPNVDYYYNPLRVGLILAHHYLDTLVYRDPEDFKIKPQLAKSWKRSMARAYTSAVCAGTHFAESEAVTRVTPPPFCPSAAPRRCNRPSAVG